MVYNWFWIVSTELVTWFLKWALKSISSYYLRLALPAPPQYFCFWLCMWMSTSHPEGHISDICSSESPSQIALRSPSQCTLYSFQNHYHYLHCHLYFVCVCVFLVSLLQGRKLLVGRGLAVSHCWICTSWEINEQRNEWLDRWMDG